MHCVQEAEGEVHYRTSFIDRKGKKHKHKYPISASWYITTSLSWNALCSGEATERGWRRSELRDFLHWLVWRRSPQSVWRCYPFTCQQQTHAGPETADRCLRHDYTGEFDLCFVISCLSFSLLTGLLSGLSPFLCERSFSPRSRAVCFLFIINNVFHSSCPLFSFCFSLFALFCCWIIRVRSSFFANSMSVSD